ncbi:MAG: hypothetical protein H6622_17270 [Halobacteriovoraceae bacterium]|nr:hypothetical protein [Halobacteriovoraceae bacterium]
MAKKIKLSKKAEKKFKKDGLLPDNEIKTKDVKVRITTSIDLDILEELKRQAAIDGEKYQTLLNKYLRACLFKEIKQSDLRAIQIASSGK